MKLKRFKKVFLVISLVVCLFTTNIGLFSLSASAANSVPAQREPVLYTIGAPVTMELRQYDSSNPLSYFDIALPRPNLYYYDGYNSYWFSEDNNHFTDVQFSYMADDWADMFFQFNNDTRVLNCSVDSSLLFRDYYDLVKYYNFVVGVQLPHTLDGFYISATDVYYYYTFLVSYTDGSGNISYTTRFIDGSQTISLNTDNYLYIPLFSGSILDTNVINSLKCFNGSDGYTYCYLINGGFRLGSDVYSHKLFLTPTSSDYATQTFLSYEARKASRLASVYNADSYTEKIVFEDLDWTSWLKNAVSGFLDFEILPNISFTDMLGLLVGMSLFILFLKIFAGG